MPYSLALIEMRGPAVRDFLHRLTTVDMRAIQSGQGSQGAWLTGQGKIQAVFYIFCISANDRYLFEVPSDAAPALLAAIDQMTFGERYELKTLALHANWEWSTESRETPAILPSRSEAFALHHGPADFGRPWITRWSEAPTVATSATEVAERDALRIAACRPWWGAEIKPEATLLHEVLLENTAVARGKGCYPGQEVVERIFTYGAPARRLVRLRLAEGSMPAAGSALLGTDGAVVGEVTTTSASAPTLALAIVKKLSAGRGSRLTSAGSTLEVDG